MAVIPKQPNLVVDSYRLITFILILWPSFLCPIGLFSGVSVEFEKFLGWFIHIWTSNYGSIHILSCNFEFVEMVPINYLSLNPPAASNVLMLLGSDNMYLQLSGQGAW